MWKSLFSRGNLLLQNIIVSFSRGYYSIVLLPKQTSCQTSHADADRFCACTAAYCQDLDTGVLVRNQTSRVKTLTGWVERPSTRLSCGPFQQRVGHTGFGKTARAQHTRWTHPARGKSALVACVRISERGHGSHFLCQEDRLSFGQMHERCVDLHSVVQAQTQGLRQRDHGLLATIRVATIVRLTSPDDEIMDIALVSERCRHGKKQEIASGDKGVGQPAAATAGLEYSMAPKQRRATQIAQNHEREHREGNPSEITDHLGRRQLDTVSLAIIKGQCQDRTKALFRPKQTCGGILATAG